jgi:hypothetical protein
VLKLADDLSVKTTWLAQRSRQTLPGLHSDGGNRKAGGGREVLHECSTLHLLKNPFGRGRLVEPQFFGGRVV